MEGAACTGPDRRAQKLERLSALSLTVDKEVKYPEKEQNPRSHRTVLSEEGKGTPNFT